MMERKIPGNLLLVFIMLLALQGCQSQTIKNVPVSDKIVSGQAGASDGTSVLFVKTDGMKTEVPIRPDGSFMANVAPGVYNILLKNASGALQLVKKSVVVEDYLTINLLEVQLVPIPRVISVSVPLVYSDSAVVEWETDIESDGRVDYGPDQTYTFSSYTDTELKAKHRLQLYGLNPSTPYHFRVVSSRHGLDSVQTFSNDYLFTTDPVKTP